jgi:hypothetical protein
MKIDTQDILEYTVVGLTGLLMLPLIIMVLPLFLLGKFFIYLIDRFMV